MEPQEKKKPQFQHRFWAVLIALGGAQQLYSVAALRDIIQYSTIGIILSVVAALLAFAAAIGFWLKRRWGLWLYVALLVGLYVNGIYQTLSELIATGEVSWLGLRVGSLFVGTIFLFYLYSQRDEFH